MKATSWIALLQGLSLFGLALVVGVVVLPLDKMWMLVGVIAVGVCICISYAAGRLHEWALGIEREQQEAKSARLPNWTVAGLEDAQAVNVDTLLQVREVMRILENRIATANRILGETRQGDYDAEQPARRPADGHAKA